MTALGDRHTGIMGEGPAADRPPRSNSDLRAVADPSPALIGIDQAIALAGLKKQEIELGEWRLLQAAFMEADPEKFNRALDFVMKRKVTA